MAVVTTMVGSLCDRSLIPIHELSCCINAAVRAVAALNSASTSVHQA
ncbi:hypothetical protein [Nostoc sp.]